MDHDTNSDSGRFSALRHALTVYLVARVALSAWAAIARGAPPPETTPACEIAVQDYAGRDQFYFHDNPLLARLLGVWMRWDTDWYIKIALHGYSPTDGSAAFAPLYPLLIRAVGWLIGGNYLLAALLISNGAAVALLALLYRLAALDFPAEAAGRALVYLMAFPSAFFLLAGYTESLFLCFVALTLYAARRGVWSAAGGAACLAALTRQQGWLLALLVAYEALAQARWNPRSAWCGLVAAGGGPLGVALYSGYLALAGLPGFFAVQRAWRVEFAPPWATVGGAFAALLAGRVEFQDGVNLLTLLLTLALLAASFFKLRPSYWLYTAVSLLIVLSARWPGEELHSLVRYALAFLPNWILLGALVRQKWAAVAMLVLFILLHLVLVTVFVHCGWVA